MKWYSRSNLANVKSNWNMKVIAINDSPIPESGYHHNGVYIDRAYYLGDIFEVYDKPKWGKDYLIIYHHKLKENMDVNPENFISLEEWREQKLNELGI